MGGIVWLWSLVAVVDSCCVMGVAGVLLLAGHWLAVHSP